MWAVWGRTLLLVMSWLEITKDTVNVTACHYKLICWLATTERGAFFILPSIPAISHLTKFNHKVNYTFKKSGRFWYVSPSNQTVSESYCQHKEETGNVYVGVKEKWSLPLIAAGSYTASALTWVKNPAKGAKSMKWNLLLYFVTHMCIRVLSFWLWKVFF